MPKKRVKRKHSVTARLQPIELFKAGCSIDLDLYASKQKLGTLMDRCLPMSSDFYDSNKR